MTEKETKEALSFYDEVIGKRVRCYDEMLGIIADIIVSYLSKQKEMHLVDLGSGTGNLEAILAPVFHDNNSFVAGYDVSEPMLDFAADKIRRLGYNASGSRAEHIVGAMMGLVSHFCFIKLDLEKETVFFPVYTGCEVDIVASNLVFHSFDKATKWSTFQNVFRMLKPGGLLLIGDKFTSDSETVRQLFSNVSEKWSHGLKQGWSEQDHQKYANIWKLQGEEGDTDVEFLGTMENYRWALQSIGFQEVDCMYQMYNYGVIYAKK